MSDVYLSKEMADKMMKETESKLFGHTVSADFDESTLTQAKLRAMYDKVIQSPLVPPGQAIIINPSAAGLFDSLPEMPVFKRHAKPQVPLRRTTQRVRRRQEEILAARSRVLLDQSEAIEGRRVARRRIAGTP